jgi:hypothetical protein
MDACPRDRRPKETAGAVAGILAMFAAMLALMILC